MQVPSKRKCRKAVNTLLRNHGVKVVNHHRWYHKKKKKYAKSILIEAGLDALADRLEDTAMYIKWGKKKLILTPGNMWAGKMSKGQLIHTMALFAHEMAHHEQAEGERTFLMRYVVDSGKRTSWEADACVAGADIYRAFSFTIDAHRIFDATWATMYHLDSENIAFARAKYNRRIRAHLRGQAASTMGGELVALLVALSQRGY